MQEGEKIVIPEEEFRKRFVYDQDSLLGEGGFAKVYKAYDRQFGETVALKFFTKSELQKYDIISEMRSSRRFTHKNIIRVHDARVVRFVNSFGIAEDVQVGILEYANAGNLQDFLDTAPSQEDFKQVIIGILQGLQYLHTEKKVIHRDLSPDNILMVEDHNVWIPKIADFGISKQIDMQTLKVGNKVSSELVGKMEYMAPEQFNPKKYGTNSQIATNVDLWAFGVILTEIFTEHSPFGDRNTAQSPMQIMHNVLHNPIPSAIRKIPEPYGRVVRQCLVKDAKKRVKSGQELINIISTYKPRKPIPKTPFVVAALILLLLSSIGLWYYYADEGTVESNNLTQSQGSLKQMSSAGVPDDSLKINPDSFHLDEDTDTNGNVSTEIDPISSEINNRPAQQESTTSQSMVAENTEEMVSKQDLVRDVLRALRYLDNSQISLQSRKDMVSSYIDKLFTGKNADVTVRYVNPQKNQEQQNIEKYLNYIVNTSGMTGDRDWEMEADQINLVNYKISSMTLNQL